MTRITLLLAAALLATGCASKQRYITAQAVSSEGLYVAYWEGTCNALTGCGVGDGKITFCKLDEATNALDCKDQESANALLHRKAE